MCFWNGEDGIVYGSSCGNVVDEGFGALDPQNIEAVISLLHRLKRYYRLILVISHVEVIKDSVDDVIVITREGMDSKVKYE